MNGGTNTHDSGGEYLLFLFHRCDLWEYNTLGDLAKRSCRHALQLDRSPPEEDVHSV